jgi:sphinganine-1-phosphate aldolase
VTALVRETHDLLFSENALNPMAFPKLRQFETEVVAMTARLPGGGDAAAGNMRSGGMESLLMAVRTARDWARAKKPANLAPEMILPATAHPALDKAAHYFDVVPVRTPVGPDFRADAEAIRAAITPRTIMIVGSAPSYPQGIVDPILALASLARESGLLFHADACAGGFTLPFVRRLGYPVPDFDLSVPGGIYASPTMPARGQAVRSPLPGRSCVTWAKRAAWPWPTESCRRRPSCGLALKPPRGSRCWATRQ